MIHLLYYLLATLLFIMLPSPGRDTQDKSVLSNTWHHQSTWLPMFSTNIIKQFCFHHGTCVNFIEDPTLWSNVIQFAFVHVFFSVLFRIITTFGEFTIPIWNFLIGSLNSHLSHGCAITRKYGRWKTNWIFPSKWVLISSVLLMSNQVHGFTTQRLHRTDIGKIVPTEYHSTGRGNYHKKPYREWIPYFNDTYALSTDNSKFYDDGLFDFVFKDSEFDQGTTTKVDARHLHVHGSIYANEWMEHMAKRSRHGYSSPFEHDDIDDLISRKTDSVTISSIPDGCSELLIDALLDVPRAKASLNVAVSSEHFVDTAHFLRLAREKHKDNVPDALTSDEIFGILLDTGCSVSCSGFKQDFHGEIAYGDFGHVNTADGQATIEGFGILRWDVISDGGKRRTILVPGYYSPTVQLRLLSPQDYARYHHFDTSGHSYAGNANWMTMQLQKEECDSKSKKHDLIHANIDPSSRLPFVLGELGHHDIKNGKDAKCHCNITSIYDVRNINLTDAQKKLKLDHDRLGHLSMQAIQGLYQPVDSEIKDFDGQSTSGGMPCLLAKDPAQLRCTVPVCEACQIAKARRRPSGATTKKENPETKDTIRAEDLTPGECVSVDQYESAVKGRRAHTRGLERDSSRFCGGTLFYDHASGYIFVHHQVSLSGPDTVNAKEAFEREMALCGHTVKKYRTDNGVFTAKSYRDSLTTDQYTDRSGVGAHHQNGVAESNIGRVQRMARAMLLHTRIHWPDEFSPDLWPFALDYAVYIYNHFPAKGKANGVSPIEVFCGTKVGCRNLRRLRVFGCPSYVLDPRLQDGKKIPKWDARSRKGQFLGFSRQHASTVGLIRHCKTGYISPQYHIVYDETFDTVLSDASVDLSETWIDLFLNSRESYLEGHDESADGPLAPLDDFWLTDGEKDLQKNSEVQQETPNETLKLKLKPKPTEAKNIRIGRGYSASASA